MFSIIASINSLRSPIGSQAFLRVAVSPMQHHNSLKRHVFMSTQQHFPCQTLRPTSHHSPEFPDTDSQLAAHPIPPLSFASCLLESQYQRWRLPGTSKWKEVPQQIYLELGSWKLSLRYRAAITGNTLLPLSTSKTPPRSFYRSCIPELDCSMIQRANQSRIFAMNPFNRLCNILGLITVNKTEDGRQ